MTNYKKRIIYELWELEGIAWLILASQITIEWLMWLVIAKGCLELLNGWFAQHIEKIKIKD